MLRTTRPVSCGTAGSSQPDPHRCGDWAARRVRTVTSDLPLLVVLAGRPGTGKTTLSRRLVRALHAAYLRIDAIETAVVRCGLARPPVGPVGYAVAHEVAAATLTLGVPVVADAVNPVPEARAGWRDLAQMSRLVVFERSSDGAEHRRRAPASSDQAPARPRGTARAHVGRRGYRRLRALG